jgi:hypothetical protein
MSIIICPPPALRKKLTEHVRMDASQLSISIIILFKMKQIKEREDHNLVNA